MTAFKLIAIFLFFPAGLRAQDAGDVFTKRAAEAGATSTQQAQAAQASHESALLFKVEGGSLTYEAVLADPDNLSLNYEWAKKQILSGDVKGASSTLERVLMTHPGMTKVRLMYGIVLYRLDDGEDAERELRVLVDGPASPDEKAEAQAYLKLIAARRRRAHYNAGLSLGWGFDDNRGAASASGKLLFVDTPIPLTSAAQRHGDTAVTLTGNLGASQDLGFQRGHSLFESFTYYQGEQTTFKNLNLKAYSGRVGGVFKSLWADFIGTALIDHVQLSQATFLRDYGFEQRVERHLSPRRTVIARAAYQYQDYSPTEQLPTARQRDGKQWEFALGYETWVLPSMRLTPSVGYTVKDAASTFDAFRRNSLALDHAWLLGRGFFLLSSVAANFDRYQTPEPLVSGKTIRSDDTYRFRTTFGVPLSKIYRPLEGFIATAGYEYYTAISNVLNYSYTSNKVSAVITYSWSD